MTIWGRVKNEVDIRDVYPKTLNSRGRGECMLHENTSSPSFQVYPGNTWTCFSCKHTGEEIKGGDVIDCYAHLHRKSRIEAVRELAEQYGINPGDYDPEEYREYLDNLHTQKQVFRIFARLCYDELLSSEHYDRIKRERGFTEETIEEFKIGLFNNNVRNRMQSDFGDLELIKYGFKTISEDNRRGNWIMGNRIVYPYLDNNQDPVYFIYRRIESDVDFRENAKYIKHPVKNTIENVLFGYFTHEQRNKPLVITEGITDAISVFQANFPCLSPVTTSFKEDDIEKMVRYAHGWSKIVVINDNEESEHGLRGAEKTILALLEHDLPAYLGNIPNPDGLEKVDLDDYLQADTQEERESLLTELCDDAIYALDYHINKLRDVPVNKVRTETEKILRTISKMKNISVSRALSDIKSATGINISELREWMEELQQDEFKASEISMEITQKHGILIPEEMRDKIIVYKDGYYQIKKDHYIDKWINHYFVKHGIDDLSDGKQRSKRSNIKNYTINNRMISIDRFNRDNTINLKNGIIDLDDLTEIDGISELELHEHTKNNYSLIRLPVEFDPSARPGELKQFMIDTVGDDNYTMLCEAIGETMLGKPYLFQKCNLLVGLERTGKSTLMNIIVRLIGKYNASIVSIQEIAEDKFAVADLFGKLMNVYPDLPAEELKEVDKFKQAVGDEFLKGNEKYGDRFVFRNTAKWWMSANTLPEPGELTGAFFRRFTITECHNQISEEDKDVNKIDKIATPETLSGLLNEALMGLKRLLERGRYESHFTDNTEEVYKKHSNSANHFIREYCEYKEIPEEEYTEMGNTRHEYEIEKDVLLEAINEFEKKIGTAQTKSVRLLTTKLKKTDYFIRYERSFQRDNEYFSLYGNIKFNKRAFRDFDCLDPIEDKHPDDLTDSDIDPNHPARQKDKKRIIKRNANTKSGHSIRKYM